MSRGGRLGGPFGANLLSIFRFRRVSSPIHRLHPISKLLYSGLILIAALLFVDPLPQAVIFLTTLPMLVASKTMRQWVGSLRNAVIFIGLIALINALFSGIPFAVAMIFRLLALLTSFSIFFMTTYPEDMALAFTQMRLPYDYALAFSMAMRFVPTLAQEAQNIVDAQRSRGLELDKGRFLTRIRNYLPILVPMLLVALRRADSVAAAMESRAFGAVKKRTFLHELKFHWGDVMLILLTLLELGLLIIYRFYPHIIFP